MHVTYNLQQRLVSVLEVVSMMTWSMHVTDNLQQRLVSVLEVVDDDLIHACNRQSTTASS
jgi:hypothetical protein